jgi:hypothetical protein
VEKNLEKLYTCFLDEVEEKVHFFPWSDSLDPLGMRDVWLEEKTSAYYFAFNRHR